MLASVVVRRGIGQETAPNHQASVEDRREEEEEEEEAEVVVEEGDPHRRVGDPLRRDRVPGLRPAEGAGLPEGATDVHRPGGRGIGLLPRKGSGTDPLRAEIRTDPRLHAREIGLPRP